jgi:hypothetical protein
MKRLTCAVVAVLALAGAARAMQIKLSLEEIAQTADLIFVGTVTHQETRVNDKKTMIYTDVTFGDVQVVHATAKSVQRSEAEIKLTYAGGSFGGVSLSVSDTPTFNVGTAYLLFVSDDGRTYTTPVIGGAQGLFEVAADRVTQERYLLTAGRRAVLGVREGAILASPQRVESFANGALVAEPGAPEAAAGRVAGAPQAAVGGEPGSPESAAPLASYQPAGGALPAGAAGRPLTLAAFLAYVKDVALKTPIAKPQIRRDGVGVFYRDVDGQIRAEPIRTTKLAAKPLPVREEPAGAPVLETPSMGSATASALDAGIEPLGASLMYCGWQGPPATMEQVSSSWWEWGPNNDDMYVWNQVMDVFRYIDDDGTFNWQNWPFQESEFIGYPSSATLDDVYGSGWSAGAIAVTWTWSWCSCCSIQESDIAWNPAYSYTDSFNFSLGNSGVVLQRLVTLHELGHAWGEQRTDETYDYDEPSAMHAYYSDVVEDGWGVHSGDAYLMRRNYDEDRTILRHADVGVESYYASNGLINSTTDASSYRPGDPITLFNVTVENIGYEAASEVRVRFFLSADKNITTGDYQLGGGTYWYWTSFCGECYNYGNYSTYVPANVPPGTYYVGAIVSIGGFGSDDITWNNRTFFYNRVTVTCSGTFSFTPASRSFLRGGGASFATLNTTGSACSWSASPSASWITITSGGSGTGSRTVNYSVAANTGALRSGYIAAGGVYHTITQEAGCLTTAATPLAHWGTANGSLSTSDCLSSLRTYGSGYRPYADRFSFSGTPGERIAISLSSAAFDTYVFLLSPLGAVLAQDDDGGAGRNSRIPATPTLYYTLPAAGIYTIEVTSYASGATGAYTLRLLDALAVSVPQGVIGCQSATGLVELASPAPPAGLVVDLRDTLAALTVPATVTVPGGATSKAFTLSTSPVAADQTGSVVASYGGVDGVSGAATTSVTRIPVESLTLTPNPVAGPNPVTGAVRLACAAAPGPITVSLASSDTAVATVSVDTITIPAGFRVGRFRVKTADVSEESYAVITATANGVTRQQRLTVQ